MQNPKLEKICSKLNEFIIKSNESIKSIEINDRQQKLETEKSFFEDFKRLESDLTDYLYTNQSNKNLNFDSILNTIELLSKHITTSSFKLLCLETLIFESFIRHKSINNLTSEKIEIILNCCQIQLSSDDYFYNGDKYGDLFYRWKNLLVSVIECLNDTMLNSIVSSIQSFYEFSSKTLTNNENYESPYKEALITIKKKFKTKSIYFDLIDNKQFLDEKVPILIKNYNESITNDCVIQITSDEFEHLIESKLSDGSYPIAEKYYKQIFEAIFTGFINSKTYRSRRICVDTFSSFLISIKSTNLTKLKQFQTCLMEEMVKLTSYYTKESNNKLDDESIKVLNKLLNTYTWNQIYLQDENNISYLIKPCLKFILNCFHIETNDLKHIEYLFRANRLFNLANYSSECILILNELLWLVESKREIADLKDICSSFIDKVKPFKKVIDTMQPILFDKIICYSIENQDYNDILMNFFVGLTDLNLYPKEKNDIKRLSNLFSIITRDDVFDSFQADLCEPYSQPAIFYFNFFIKLAESFETRTDLIAELESGLICLFDKIKTRNEYYDLFLNKFNGVLINYNIIYRISNTLAIKKRPSNTVIIDNLIQIWISIKDQNLANETNLSAMNFIQIVSNNYPNELAKYANKILNYFLNDENPQMLLFSINQIIPMCYNEFIQNKFSFKFHEKILNSNAEYVYLTTSTLSLIVKHIPEFFIEKQDESSQFNRFFDLINICLENKTNKPELFSTLFFVFSAVIELIKTNSNFYTKNFFQNRNLVKKFLEFDSVQYLSKSTIIDTIGSFYKILALNEKNLDLLVNELIDLIRSNKINEFRSVFQILKEICTNSNRIDLLKVNKNFFNLNKNEPELSEVISSIIDLCEGRSLEVIDTKLDKNIENVNQLEENLSQNETKIINLNERLTKDEQNLTILNQEIQNVNVKLDEFGNVIIEHGAKIEEVNNKTLLNVPKWSKKLSELLNKDWVLVAQRLNYNENDIKAWLTQTDPCMCMLQEWFITNKTSDAINGLVKVLKSLNHLECINLIESDLKSVEANNKLNIENVDTVLEENPPDIFISFEWSCLDKANLIKKYLENENFVNIWFDDGNMGGGVVRNKRIDIGLRKCRVLVCLITNESSKDETCLNQINLAVQLNKPIIPLLLDSTLKWPPSGSLGPILSEYLFIRFFQRPKEVTNDERFWPVDKFNELIMQLKALVPLKLPNRILSPKEIKPPEVFISYQWDKQKQIIKLFNKFKSLDINCWLDIYQMGGGDSLYDKIDRGLRNCLLVISCVTKKYSLSANCRKEVALADSISKPIIPILLEEMNYPPSGPMAPTLSVLKYIDFTGDLDEQENWNGNSSKALLEAMKQYLPNDIIEKTTSKACLLS